MILQLYIVLSQALRKGSAVNFMLDCYGAKLNYDLPTLRLPYSVGAAQVDITGECTSFIMALLLPFFWSMARMWVRSRNTV